MYGFYSLYRHRGPRPFSTLKTRRRILKSIRAHTGSQCKLLSTGVTRSHLLVTVSSQAAEFCTFCLLICDCCRPDTMIQLRRNKNMNKYFVNLATLQRWKKAALQMLFICTSIQSTLSSQTPMFLADLLALVMSAPIRIESSGGGGRWRAVRTRNSVLSPFS